MLKWNFKSGENCQNRCNYSINAIYPFFQIEFSCQKRRWYKLQKIEFEFSRQKRLWWKSTKKWIWIFAPKMRHFRKIFQPRVNCSCTFLLDSTFFDSHLEKGSIALCFWDLASHVAKYLVGVIKGSIKFLLLLFLLGAQLFSAHRIAKLRSCLGR